MWTSAWLRMMVATKTVSTCQGQDCAGDLYVFKLKQFYNAPYHPQKVFMWEGNSTNCHNSSAYGMCLLIFLYSSLKAVSSFGNISSL